MKRAIAGSGIYRLFHLSADTSPTKLMVPRHYQEGGPDHICFSPSLKGCFMSLSGDRLKHMSVYVIDPDSIDEKTLKANIVKPTSEQVYDQQITKETWVMCKVRCLQLCVVEPKITRRINYENRSNDQTNPDWHVRSDYETHNIVVRSPWASFTIVKLNDSVAKKVLGMTGYLALKKVYEEHKQRIKE